MGTTDDDNPAGVGVHAKDLSAAPGKGGGEGTKKKKCTTIKEKGQKLRQDRQESSAGRTCKQKRKLFEKLRDKKISITPSRLEALENFKTSIEGAKTPDIPTVLNINLGEDILQSLQNSGVTVRGTGFFESDDEVKGWYPLKHTIKENLQSCQAILYESVHSKPCPAPIDKTVIAMGALLKMPVVILIRGRVQEPAVDSNPSSSSSSSSTKLPQALSEQSAPTPAGENVQESVEEKAEETCKYMCNTWKVFTNADEYLKYVLTELPRLVALCDAITKDVTARTDKFRDINVWKYGLKRASVALVPGGVAVVNLIGMVRLVVRILSETGMLSDKEVRKASAWEGVLASAKGAVLDNFGDAYATVIYATVLSNMSFSANVGSALASLEVLDYALLGSMAAVTGAVAAVGGYLTRPAMVDAIVNLVVSLQVIYLINPDFRSVESGEPPEADDTNSNIEMSTAEQQSGAGGDSLKDKKEGDATNPNTNPNVEIQRSGSVGGSFKDKKEGGEKEVLYLLETASIGSSSSSKIPAHIPASSSDVSVSDMPVRDLSLREWENGDERLGAVSESS